MLIYKNTASSRGIGFYWVRWEKSDSTLVRDHDREHWSRAIWNFVCLFVCLFSRFFFKITLTVCYLGSWILLYNTHTLELYVLCGLPIDIMIFVQTVYSNSLTLNLLPISNNYISPYIAIFVRTFCPHVI